MPIIRAEHLVKAFRRPRRIEGPLGALRTFFTSQYDVTRAVDGVSFSIEPGELVGYLGSNGAGKSTTIKMLGGILVPTSGTVEVSGLIPWQQREQNALNIGVVFGQRTQLWWDLPLADSLRILARMYQLDDEQYRRKLAELSDLLELEPFMLTPVRQLSLGQRMRADLAAAMLHEPPILYLDEPTIGLDVVAKERTRGFIEHMNQENGTTIMLTTHDLADVERLARRIIFIEKGTVLFDGPLAELKRRYAPYRELHIALAPGTDAAAPHWQQPGTELIADHPGRVVIRFDPDQIAMPALMPAVLSSWDVSDISIVEPALETIVRQIVESGEVKA